jgi:hypothetical protein
MRKRTLGISVIVIFIISIILANSFFGNRTLVDRESKIPIDVIKVTPNEDMFPPNLHSDDFEEPIPMTYPINTAGAEDSAFITPDGSTFFFFFTPDVRIPVEEQVMDGITGIYISRKVNAQWTKPEKVILQEPKKLAMDGCVFIQDDTMWFCSVREGYTGVNFFTAQLIDGKWQNWEYVGDQLSLQYEMGELHITADHEELYFHSLREGGRGQLDIWVSKNVNGEWQEPKNVEVINTAESEGWPFITEDGTELWFTRRFKGSPALFRSKKINDEWQEPELIISQFAGEPTLDKEGNVYFTHHFYREGEMIEADIYVAYRKLHEEVIPIDLPQTPPRGFYMGFLPVPAHNQSFEAVYLEASQSIEFVPIWGRPTPFYDLADELSGNWGFTFIESLTRGNAMFPLVHMSFIGSGLTLITPPEMEGATLSDPEWRAAYKLAALNIVRTSKPLYLSVGNEVNRWYEHYGVDQNNLNGFHHFVSLYEELYDAVKHLSPKTNVFCTFSREIVSTHREADLEVLSMFNSEKLDVLVFTSYPHAVQSINRPQDIPDNYYHKAFEYISPKPIGFSELGWPSHSAFGGEEGQADFILQMSTRLTREQGINLHWLGWVWLHDLNADDNMGLKYHDGTEKAAYEVWKKLSQSFE